MAKATLTDEERRVHRREARRRWRAKNPEKVRAYDRRPRARNPEVKKRSDAKWRAKDPEHALRLARERVRRWQERNRDAILKARRAKYRRGTERPHLSAGEQAEIRAFYRAGLTFKEIGHRMKRTGGTIARYLRTLESIRARPVKSGPGAVGWKGGRVLSHGYVYVWVPPDDPMACMRDKAGRVGQHRLVLARTLGRPLLASETVHHINGDRSDNRSENLQLRQGKHGTGIVLACLACGSHRIGPVMLASATSE